MPLRIVYCGTPEFALPSLRLILEQPDFRIEGVVTQPDRPRGRGKQVSSSPVKDAALEAGLAVYQPQRIKSESAHDYFKRIAADVVVIIAYGQIIPATLLCIPRFGWINLHASLLPRYRGAAPIHWAIANGETRTGLTTMQVGAGLDTGPVFLQYQTEIGPDETAPQLSSRLSEAGAPLMVETLRAIAKGEIRPAAQDDSLATLAPLLKKENGRVDWSLPAQKIYNQIRGFDPWPGAFTFFRGQKCEIWGRPAIASDPVARNFAGPAGTLHARGAGIFVACGERSALRLENVRLEGRKRITAREFVIGARLEPGEAFGAHSLNESA